MKCPAFLKDEYVKILFQKNGKKIFDILDGFQKRGGFWVAGASLLTKFSGIILSVVIVRIFTKEVYGEISYARSLISVFIPFMGFGIPQSLLRFGSYTFTGEEKERLYYYSLIRGGISSTILSIVLIFFSSLSTQVTLTPNSEKHTPVTRPT